VKYMRCMRSTLVVLSLLSFVMIISDCGDEGEEAALQDYCPFAVGNLWYYAYTITLESQDTTLSATGDIRMEIVGDTMLINGQDVFIQEMYVSMMGNVDQYTYYIAETDTSILRYYSLMDTTPEVLLELPLETGNSWTVSGYQTASVKGRKYVSVPAGNYSNCWEIEYTAYGDTAYDYYAANVGLIKERMSDTEGGMTLTVMIELEHVVIR